jgi:anti-sigma regulatory factor (Ser/Thr protein kinase)
MLRSWRLDGLAHTVELLVSELVTNAIRHAGGEVRLRLERGRDAVLCEVCDNVRSLPQLQTPTAMAEYGRGIVLVSELSDSWGCRRTASGKVVWFTVRLPRDGRALPAPAASPDEPTPHYLPVVSPTG